MAVKWLCVFFVFSSSELGPSRSTSGNLGQLIKNAMTVCAQNLMKANLVNCMEPKIKKKEKMKERNRYAQKKW